MIDILEKKEYKFIILFMNTGTTQNTKFKEEPDHWSLVTGYVDSLFISGCKSDINQFWGKNKVKGYYKKDSKPLPRENILKQTCLFYGEDFEYSYIFWGKFWRFE